MLRKKIMILSMLTITGIAFAQSVEVKDDASHILIQINDEGASGSITLPQGGAPGTPDDKIYNIGGDLYWSGNELATDEGYSVYDNAQGGIVFWVDETGEHGLVCALTDQSSSTEWWAGTLGDTQAKGNRPFSGEMNTCIIIAAHVALGGINTDSAAFICSLLQITENGKTYGDWYLPSIRELNIMYDNLHLWGFGGFAASTYWSSTEYNVSNAYYMNFVNGSQSYHLKDIARYVRAVRAF